ncbi:hypothetical protein M422DRAFT_246421 [Sphaerobolus stellatus SS14]|nr:hypothetical protein M422DRAFT_246421 [Sphaerobolus stellatus SS14]
MVVSIYPFFPPSPNGNYLSHKLNHTTPLVQTKSAPTKSATPITPIFTNILLMQVEDAPFTTEFLSNELLILEVKVEEKVIRKGNEDKGDEEKGEEKESALKLPDTMEDKMDEDAKDRGAVMD